ncbi:hypothetical protein INR49_000848, partial [Caranx melampygus]
VCVCVQAKRAVQRGATAVIFDVSENPDAIDQLNQVAEDPLKRPVVYVKGNDAVKLMNIVNKQKVARARIQHRPPRVGGFEADVDEEHVCEAEKVFFCRCEDKPKFLL